MVLCELLVGGAEKMALQLLRALHGKGCEFVVASIRSGGALGDDFRETGAEVHDGLTCCRLDPMGAFRIGRLIRRRAIDVVVVVDVPRNALFYGLAGAALSGRDVPAVCWCHSRPDGQSGNFPWQLRTYAALGWLPRIV